jgi:hypothetical protein
MTVTPTGEPGRFFVSSETDGLPWLVDLHSPFGEPKCGCAIEHNRTEERWACKHIKAALRFHNATKPKQFQQY